MANPTNKTDSPKVLNMTDQTELTHCPSNKMDEASARRFPGLHSIYSGNNVVKILRIDKKRTLTPAIPPLLRNKVPTKIVTATINTIHRLYTTKLLSIRFHDTGLNSK